MGESTNIDKEKKKKKKKNKNKNKKKPVVEGPKGNGPHQSDNIFDNTQSTVRENGYSGRHLPNNGAPIDHEQEGEVKDFTPLKDKIGQSFFED